VRRFTVYLLIVSILLLDDASYALSQYFTVVTKTILLKPNKQRTAIDTLTVRSISVSYELLQYISNRNLLLLTQETSIARMGWGREHHFLKWDRSIRFCDSVLEDMCLHKHSIVFTTGSHLNGIHVIAGKSWIFSFAQTLKSAITVQIWTSAFAVVKQRPAW
jgi:hypothetical protein